MKKHASSDLLIVLYKWSPILVSPSERKLKIQISGNFLCRCSLFEFVLFVSGLHEVPSVRWAPPYMWTHELAHAWPGLTHAHPHNIISRNIISHIAVMTLGRYVDYTVGKQQPG